MSSGARALSAPEFIRILERTRGRERALAAVLGYTGARLSEALELELEQVMQQGQVRRTIVFTRHQTKGRKRSRRVPVPDSLELVLEQYLASGHVNLFGRHLFPSGAAGGFSMKRLSRSHASRLVGSWQYFINAPVSSHSFRKMYATAMVNEGIPLTTVSRMLGHSSLQTTRHYVEPSPEDFERAVDTLPPFPRESHA